jgi:lysozyme
MSDVKADLKDNKKTGHRKWVAAAALFLLLSALFAGCMAGRLITPLFAKQYALRGVDVSHYQGEIDWQELASQGISFAYIKATEGSSHTDEYFEKNWAEAADTVLLMGAYHFFSFSSPGVNQAEHFAEVVGGLSGKLVPAVDVEYYGGQQPDQERAKQELAALLNRLEELYDVKPLIYTTYEAYDDLIKGSFEDYPLWIRNVYWPPDAGFHGTWSFWQYTDRQELSGYSGSERYIDMNVFAGNEEQLQQWILP